MEAKAPLSRWGIVWIAVSTAAFVFGLVFLSFHWFMVGLAPLMLAIAVLRSRPSSEAIILEESRIVSLSGKDPIEYAAIRAITIGEVSLAKDTVEVPPGPIRILHDHGQLYLPEMMNVSHGELYRFLCDRLPLRPERQIIASLADHINEQASKFGPEMVTVIHQRDPRIKFHGKNKWRILAEATILTGLAWLVVMLAYPQFAPLPDSHTFWIGLGIFSLIFGGLFWLISGVPSSRKRKHLASHLRSCIVVSPAGLAMDQGDLKGKLRWEEITGFKSLSDGKIGGSHEGPLRVAVAGGEILILDIYEKSLTEIASLIMRNTRHPGVPHQSQGST